MLRSWARFLAEVPRPWVSTQTLPQSQGELGEEARKLLDNPVLIEALDRIERKLVGSWRSSLVGDAAGREAAYRLHWAAEQFRAELRIMIANAGMNARQRGEGSS
jgi:hypothetical protein